MVNSSSRFIRVSADNAEDFTTRLNEFLAKNENIVNLVQICTARDGWFHAFILVTVMEPITVPAGTHISQVAKVA